MPLPSVDRSPKLSLILSDAISKLGAGGIPEADAVVRLLASHVFNLTTSQLGTAGEQNPPAGAIADFELGIGRLLKHEPVQYVTGETVFMGFPLKVDRSVLIPRPETELLVELVVEIYRAHPKDLTGRAILTGIDIGTGSGNVPIAICKFLPECTMVALDVSPQALLVASQNMELNGVTHRIAIDCRDILKSIPALPDRVDFIVSNPPYISIEEYGQLAPNVRNYEPRVALSDDGDGLTFYYRIAEIGTLLLKSNGALFFEVAFDQALRVSAILGGYGYQDIHISRDYSGIERLISCRWRPRPPADQDFGSPEPSE